MRKISESFWVEFLDLCVKHGVTEFRTATPGTPGRLILAYDAHTAQGELIVSDIELRTKDDATCNLEGTTLLHVYFKNVDIYVSEAPSVRSLVQYVRGTLRRWRITSR